jgi:hypothetical protein
MVRRALALGAAGIVSCVHCTFVAPTAAASSIRLSATERFCIVMRNQTLPATVGANAAAPGIARR